MCGPVGRRNRDHRSLRRRLRRWSRSHCGRPRPSAGDRGIRSCRTCRPSGVRRVHAIRIRYGALPAPSGGRKPLLLRSPAGRCAISWGCLHRSGAQCVGRRPGRGGTERLPGCGCAGRYGPWLPRPVLDPRSGERTRQRIRHTRAMQHPIAAADRRGVRRSGSAPAASSVGTWTGCMCSTGAWVSSTAPGAASPTSAVRDHPLVDSARATGPCVAAGSSAGAPTRGSRRLPRWRGCAGRRGACATAWRGVGSGWRSGRW